jgi:type IV secretory pathway TrbD component
MQTLKAAVLYFTLVFGAGFLLGPIRIFWIAPRLGTRTAELLEAPIMLAVMIASACWIVRHLAMSSDRRTRLFMGCGALVLMLFAEFSLVLWLRGLTLRQYFATRDPVSGTVYYLMLILFALMPLIVSRSGVK